MLSKVSNVVLKRISDKVQKNFGFKSTVLNYMYKDNTSCPNYIASRADPTRPLDGHTSKTRQELEQKYEVSKLSNGITVLTESSGFPSNVHFGILLDVGTRDETTETSGSLLSIKNTYYKTILNTNETINYGVVQMSGGNLNVEFDQETTYFSAKCLAHDGVDVFNVLADCALEPRSVLAANIGVEKNKNTHKFTDFIGNCEEFNNATFRTAYGLRGLGLPLRGLKGNVGNLSAYVLQKFQLENITPNRIFVCGSGIESHQEFLDLVSDQLSYIPSVDALKTTKRSQAEYTGGEVRNNSEDNSISVGLYFEGVNWTSPDVPVLLLANTLLNSGRITRNIKSKHPCVDYAHSTNVNFTDSGIFGLRVSGAAEKSNNILTAIVDELKGLTKSISNEELARAKSILNTNILLNLERQGDRLQDSVKYLRSFGKVQFSDVTNAINKVTGDQVNKTVAKVLATTPTFVAYGGGTNRLPSFDQIRNSLKI